MRDVGRRLAILEGRRVQQEPQWDFSDLSDAELEFVRSFKNVKDMSGVPTADLERLGSILLSAGRVETAA
jgi:hypothetical protein